LLTGYATRRSHLDFAPVELLFGEFWVGLVLALCGKDVTGAFDEEVIDPATAVAHGLLFVDDLCSVDGLVS